jgi:hypothetical protein
VRAEGRPLGITDTGAGWSRDDRCELSTETVARALDFFRRKVLQAGAWDHTLGATIRSSPHAAAMPPNARWRVRSGSMADSRASSSASISAAVPR